MPADSASAGVFFASGISLLSERPRRFALGTRPARCRRRILGIRERHFAFPSGEGGALIETGMVVPERHTAPVGAKPAFLQASALPAPAAAGGHARNLQMLTGKQKGTLMEAVLYISFNTGKVQSGSYSKLLACNMTIVLLPELALHMLADKFLTASIRVFVYYLVSI